jgi:hypothetical protein
MTTLIPLQDFLSNFAVRVVNYVADNNNSMVHVRYEVRCILNGRLSVHLTDVDVTTLPTEYTSQDVLNAAWDNVKVNVTAWATTNVVKPQLIEFAPDNTTDDISVSDFNNNFLVRVYRWELYPRVQSSSWVVGFDVYNKSGYRENKTLDCAIPIEGLCGNTFCLDIMEAAWLQMKAQICSWAAERFSLQNVINTSYVPTSVDGDEPLPS